MRKNKLDELRELLEGIPPGSVPEAIRSRLEQLLAQCWDDFEGSDWEGMAGYKLLGRMESPEWDPPTLAFIIERHGGTVLGSSRAELQRWTVNLEEKRAYCEPAGYRQIGLRDSPWKAGPVAEELARLILEGRENPRLKWLSASKDRVMIRTPEIIPNYYDSPKETVSGRRKRLFLAMEALLVPSGWKRNRNIWEKVR